MTSLLWPQNLPDLNPADYSVWGILQENVYKRCVTDLVDLKHCIRTEWTVFNYWITQSLQLLCISGAVVSQCPSRLAAVISSILYFNIVFGAITVTILAVVD